MHVQAEGNAIKAREAGDMVVLYDSIPVIEVLCSIPV